MVVLDCELAMAGRDPMTSLDTVETSSPFLRLEGIMIQGIGRYSTGIPSLDGILDGGWPLGRLVEVFGKEAVGKTSLALKACASVQENGGTAAFVDAERGLDPNWARAIGVDLTRLLVCQPSCGEDAIEAVRGFINNKVSLVVVDSVAALVPRVEQEGNMHDVSSMLQARLMSKACRILCPEASAAGTTVLFTNQLRPVEHVTFGPSDVSSGGNALKYYASVRIDLAKVGVDGSGPSPSLKLRARVVKSKVSMPFRSAEFMLGFNGWFSEIKEEA